MVIPVVSSTFASFARQFRDVGAGCLGYLFIDEAGQAVPQAAAGAIWRANRVMAVGDPIQIEPVFTTPPPLVRTLERIAALPDCANVSPTEVSVQILADRCNALGASVLRKGESNATWIGSPLRVHRRCADPMFGISCVATKIRTLSGYMIGSDWPCRISIGGKYARSILLSNVPTAIWYLNWEKEMFVPKLTGEFSFMKKVMAEIN